VLVIGGSPGMTGAVGMAARAALRTGSGLATVLTPHTCTTAVDVAVPELMVMAGRVGKFGTLNNQFVPLKGINGVLIGPGMRADYDTRDFTERVVLETRVPLVMDADALAHVAGFPEWFREGAAPRYLTPHPGEMARMVGGSSADIQADRVGALKRAYRSAACNIVLKGSRSRVVTRSGRMWVNLNGNPGMATGGSGDVLAGMVTSIAAQGVYPELVLPLAVYLHGKAGDLALMRKGEAGMIAGDLVDAIPAVMRRVQGR
jgi:NAD(P)H-hydrate epimerase